jgi:NADH-quinone oxidoreductase subunit D
VSPVENQELSEYRKREQSITLAPVEEQLVGSEQNETTEELLTLNFGPHHPATHGVLRLLVTLQAEIVRDIKPIIGYVHTGIEKTAEDKATSRTTSTRWPTSARSRRSWRWRFPSAPSTCA